MRTIVLASQSPYRRQLLDRLGLAYEPTEHACDESAIKAQGMPPETLAQELARGKAESVAERYPDALIIGSDQIAVADGEVLDKPGTTEKARAQLTRLAGKEHRLITAVCLLDSATGEHGEAVDIHRMKLRPLTEAQIARYVDAEQPLDCVGAYKVEGLGAALFEYIRGDDFTAVIGLPLTRLTALLAARGIELP